ncbi:hypothetical protein K1W54_38770 [Micromonospora sp. CPCC 205371]|nr:hypothetical protein [Micromonospora sp. CPCC 205371]
MALFRRGSSPLPELIREVNTAFLQYTPDSQYFEATLAPLLARLYALIKIGDVRSVDQLDAIAAPLRTMPPLTAALCAASVLHSSGRSLAEIPLGEPLTQLIAAAGMAAAQKAVPQVTSEQDCRQLITALDVLWRFEPSPYREIDHAQVVYLTGHLALTLGYDHDALASRWRQAVRLLDEVDPAAARNSTERDTVERTKRHLERSWTEQLAALTAGS